MGLLDKMPEMKKNSFTVDEASDLFKKLSEEIKDASTPKEIIDTLIAIAEIAIKIIAVV